MAHFLKSAAAALMMAASLAMPPMGQQRAARPVRTVQYDGDGKKVQAKAHPRHNRKQGTRDWQRYADRVRATHSTDAFGNRQIDPRDDKYLHSHARSMRGLVKALERAGR